MINEIITKEKRVIVDDIDFIDNHDIIINKKIRLMKRDKIVFTCSFCGEQSTQEFRFKEKFFDDTLMCHQCAMSINNSFRRNDIKDKIKKINLKKYGFENATSNPEIKKKIEKTQKAKNQGVFAFNNQKQKDKIKQKYGDEVIFKTQYFKNKSKESMIEKYGNDCPMRVEEIKNKISSTMNERYGSNWFVTSDSFKEMSFDVTTTSKAEDEIADWLQTLDINIERNNRKLISPNELDIYIPSHNVAIEFNGLYWHSDRFRDKNYHLNKTIDCESKGIRLIHIFEDEWMSTRRIGARQTVIREIDAKVKNQFLDKYHIQGHDISSIKLGAFFQNELIGVMTFSRPRRSLGQKQKRNNVYELSRFATISDTYTPGLASKILKFFETKYNPTEIYSYADRRWSQGDLYLKLGFNFSHFTQPNYWYFKDNIKRSHRYLYRKSNLVLFENYSEDKTEFEIMNQSGYHRIYDCGSYKFVKLS